MMTVHLVNPSHLSFGVGVITPRWLFVLAAATPAAYGRPRITDETLEPFDFDTVQPGDVVGDRHSHRQRAARIRDRHAGAGARGDGRSTAASTPRCTRRRRTVSAARTPSSRATATWSGRSVLDDATRGTLQPIYEAGRVDADRFVPARWELLPEGRYMWGSVQTVRGCPKHCSFCSVWRTDGQKPRQRGVDAVVEEIVELRRRGFRFVALADDNFYPVTLTDLAMAERQGNAERLEQLRGAARGAIRADGPAGAAAIGHGVLHPDHHGGRRG